MQTIAWTYQMGHSTVHYIILETAKAIWEVLSKTHLCPPSSEGEWKKIAKEFNEQWNFPNCLGALDGKHINIQAPARSGSRFFNYKKCFSVILLACCDANYNFTLVDIGAYGSESDGGVLANSVFGNKFDKKEMSVPPANNLPNTDIPLPYTMVADEAFPLKPYIMRPFPGRNLDNGKRIFNYRLCRARRTIENAFGILVNRWRLLKTTIIANVENVDTYINAIVCLHNYVKKESEAANEQIYIPAGFLDTEDHQGNWRDDVEPLQSVGRLAANRAARVNVMARDTLKDYFLSNAGRVPWQNNVLEVGRHFNLI